MDQLRLIVRQFRDLFLRMTGAQQLSIIALALSIMIMLGLFLSSAMTSPPLRPFLWRVTSNDAGPITDKLNTMNVDWELKNGSLFVDSDVNLETLRMSLSQDGLLPEDMSFDFQKMVEQDGFALTKDERSTRYDLALGTEIAKNIKSMTDIQEANVIVPKEEASPLLKSHQPRTASVTITVRGGRALRKVESKGIIALVASAVKGLAQEKVSIVDSRGRSYSLNSDDDAADKLEMTWKAERHYAEIIESMLREFIPRVKATVSVSLDLSKRRSERKDYQDDRLNKNGSSVLMNNFQTKEDSTSKEGSQGVAGAASNVPGDIREGDGGDQMKMGKSEKKEMFDSSVVQEYITHDTTMMISGVSVVVGNKKFASNFNDMNPQYEDFSWLSPAGNTILGASLSELVASALGLESTDMVKITEQNMTMPAPYQPKSSWEELKASIDLAWVFMAVMSLAGVIALSKMVKKAQPEEEILPMPEYEEDEKGDDLPPLKEPELDANVRQIENRVKEIVDEDPVKAAGLIRHWLSSE